ncbi:Uncharacterized damage-inducible protein DinB (forms a four-helix bundle) [Paenibacillus sp. UNCCL117]|uniref:DinB family protein n=1 Tax=unclassified Paenibacillus TaxID=185978 RepID=UPI00087F75D8|nr:MULTISPECIES: DinB family protein [unclassified Paenibacillus]SDC90841.1 Uncharacterized damage-inducible protein DinB (forms a four-helix bundle) [Paenibacillus sp. cl123]SFW28953.1 Uncharacterized damage-inducible protein DinB (forms a four-helix bundle) [Paenibacillus sp. UNCCL117]
MKSYTQMFAHLEWANAKIAKALRAGGEEQAQALKLFAHTLGAERVWLTRIRGEDSSALAIWPELDMAACESLMEINAQGFRDVLEQADERQLAEEIVYRNSAGTQYRTVLADILLHTALHGMYHRGQINHLLRLGNLEPASVDYILYAREN